MTCLLLLVVTASTAGSRLTVLDKKRAYYTLLPALDVLISFFSVECVSPSSSFLLLPEKTAKEKKEPAKPLRPLTCCEASRHDGGGGGRLLCVCEDDGDDDGLDDALALFSSEAACILSSYRCSALQSE